MTTAVATRHPLYDAIVRAVCSSDQVSVTLANGSEQEIDAAEEEAWQAKNALIVEFRNLGIGENWLRKLGSVI
jgi:hypothetical protein